MMKPRSLKIITILVLAITMIFVFAGCNDDIINKISSSNSSSANASASNTTTASGENNVLYNITVSQMVVSLGGELMNSEFSSEQVAELYTIINSHTDRIQETASGAAKLEIIEELKNIILEKIDSFIADANVNPNILPNELSELTETRNEVENIIQKAINSFNEFLGN